MRPLFSRPPLVSVVLASYNHARFVERAVRSVLDQTVRDVELIVVDDGSTDGTPERVEAIGDPRLRTVRLGINRRAHPRNAGLSLAKGKYVAFQNSDDEWAAGKLAAQLEVLERRRDVAACFTGVEIVGPDGGPLAASWAHGVFATANRGRLAWLRRFFEYGNCLCLPSALARRDAVEKAGRFRASLVQLGDLDLWVRLAAAAELFVVDQPLTRMRIVPGGNLSEPGPEATRRSMREFSEVLGRYVRPPLWAQVPAVFAESIPGPPRTPALRKGWLARHAWSLDSWGHRLFADRLMAELLDDAAVRREIAEGFGVELIREFIRRRGAPELELPARPLEPARQDREEP